jgi:hypothetical protein
LPSFFSSPLFLKGCLICFIQCPAALLYSVLAASSTQVAVEGWADGSGLCCSILTSLAVIAPGQPLRWRNIGSPWSKCTSHPNWRWEALCSCQASLG